MPIYSPAEKMRGFLSTAMHTRNWRWRDWTIDNTYPTRDATYSCRFVSTYDGCESLVDLSDMVSRIPRKSRKWLSGWLLYCHPLPDGNCRLTQEWLGATKADTEKIAGPVASELRRRFGLTVTRHTLALIERSV